MPSIDSEVFDLPESVVTMADQDQAVHIAPSGDHVPPAETPWSVEVAAPNSYYESDDWRVTVTKPNPERGGLHEPVDSVDCSSRSAAIQCAAEFVQDLVTEA